MYLCVPSYLIQAGMSVLSLYIMVVFSHRYCFVENLLQEGLMSTSEYVVLDEWFKWITSHLDTGGDLIGKYEYLEN
jgi:hypothetical protein